MTHPPEASIEGAHMGEDLDQTGMDEKAANHAVGQSYAETTVKPTDVEDSQEREPLNVKEAAAALPPWHRQVLPSRVECMTRLQYDLSAL